MSAHLSSFTIPRRFVALQAEYARTQNLKQTVQEILLLHHGKVWTLSSFMAAIKDPLLYVQSWRPSGGKTDIPHGGWGSLLLRPALPRYLYSAELFSIRDFCIQAGMLLFPVSVRSCSPATTVYHLLENHKSPAARHAHTCIVFQKHTPVTNNEHSVPSVSVQSTCNHSGVPGSVSLRCQARPTLECLDCGNNITSARL